MGFFYIISRFLKTTPQNCEEFGTPPYEKCEESDTPPYENCEESINPHSENYEESITAPTKTVKNLAPPSKTSYGYY